MGVVLAAIVSLGIVTHSLMNHDAHMGVLVN